MPMDKEKALAGLRLARQTCCAALAALADPQKRVELSINKSPNGVSTSGETSRGEALPSASTSEPSLDIKLNDFNGLLTLIYQNVTKLGLAANPSITIEQFQAAVVTPAKEIAAHVDALASCACSVDPAKDGRALVRELRWAAEDVARALQTLIEVFVERVERQGTDGSSEQEHDSAYLIRTGVVHDAIDHVRSSLSRNNRAAVHARWVGIIGGLGDCMSEIQEMVEEEEGEDEKEDEWKLEGNGVSTDDLNAFGNDDFNQTRGKALPTSKPTKDEIWRMSQTSNLLKFTHAMAKRVSSRILESAEMIPASPGFWDELLARGDALLKTSDDLVDALYIPQEAVTISDQLTLFNASIMEIHVILSSLNLMTRPQEDQNSDITNSLSNLTSQINALKLNEHSLELDRAKFTKERRWFDVCFSQVYKSADAIQAKLNLGPEFD